MPTTVPWKYGRKSVGYQRGVGGVFYIRRTIHGEQVRLSTGCVTLEAANAEYERFEKDPVHFVSRLGRAPLAPVPVSLGRRAKNLAHRYRITAEAYDELLAEQDGKCAICGSIALFGKRRTLEVDHCHERNLVRGLLCGPCNKGIGLFSDSAALLRNAADYLDRVSQRVAVATVAQ
jgi:hypothetical protein